LGDLNCLLITVTIPEAFIVNKAHLVVDEVIEIGLLRDVTIVETSGERGGLLIQFDPLILTLVSISPRLIGLLLSLNLFKL
jgi:hypothetical protein